MCVYLRKTKLLKNMLFVVFAATLNVSYFFCNRKVSFKRIKQNVHSAYDFLPPMPNCGGVLISIF